jgi:type I restriction enzyme R subunit
MTKITESAIELLAIQRLESLGYNYLYGPDITLDGHSPERETFEQVLLLNRLKTAVRKINPGIPVDAQAEAIKEIQRIASPELLANNEAFHRLLTEGIPVSKQVDGNERGDRVW